MNIYEAIYRLQLALALYLAGGAVEFAGMSFAALAATAVGLVVKALTSRNNAYDEFYDNDLFLKKEQDKKESKDKSDNNPTIPKPNGGGSSQKKPG